MGLPSSAVDELAAAPLPKRPSGPLVFGVLSIIFGSLMLLGTLVAVFMTMAMQTEQGTVAAYGDVDAARVKLRAAAARRRHEETRGSAVTSTVVFSVMSLALIVIGVGQTKYRPWARRWSLVWAALALASLLVVVYQQVAILGPAQERFNLAMRELQPASATASWLGAGTTTLVATLIVDLPYPLLLLWYFRRPQVRVAMDGAADPRAMQSPAGEPSR